MWDNNVLKRIKIKEDCIIITKDIFNLAKFLIKCQKDD